MKKKNKEVIEIKILLSIVIVIRDNYDILHNLLNRIEDIASSLVSDYEIIIIDNGSSDINSQIFKELTSEKGFPNLQIYKLVSYTDNLTARWVGFENSIGDFVVSFDPVNDCIDNIESVIKSFNEGVDIVFTRRVFPRNRKIFLSKMIYIGFGKLAKFATGFDLDSYSSSLIGINRAVINYLLQFSDPQIKFRNLPSLTGFSRCFINMHSSPRNEFNFQLLSSLSRGLRLITSSSKNPLRIATLLSAFGTFFSFSYSVYIVLIWMFKDDITPGWVSLSMQQSSMFFLISLVLLVLSEYILELSRKTNSGPSYFIAEEFTSAKLKRKERINVEIENKFYSKTKNKNFLDS